MRAKYSGLQFDEVKMQINKFCSFSLSQKIIDELLPINNKLLLKQELKRLSQALQSTISYGSMPFSGIKDITNIIILASKDATLKPDELLDVASQAYGIKQINNYIRSIDKPIDAIKDLTDSLVSFQDTSEKIYHCISNSGEIFDNASSKLSSIRKEIKNIQSTIANKMNKYITNNSEYLQDSIIAQRNGRSVVLVKNSYKNTVGGFQYGTTASNNATYVEPAIIVEHNNQLQQALYDEASEIERILFSLSQLVKKDCDAYLANTKTLALLDSYYARAQYAKNNRGIIGEISENDLTLNNVRHPLIDSSKVVANSYHMIDPIKTILITGANTGGKTVSLKVVGLSALMFLSAMPVLADEAKIPLFDHIYYDIGDNQSIDDDLSTFGSHIKNIAWITQKATNKSLVLLDELGSATDPAEGQALACAVLDYLTRKDIYVLATTHYSSLKSYGSKYDSIMVSSVEFDSKDLKPTYHYIENSIGQSNGIRIAQHYGVNDEIISLANQLKLQQQSESDRLVEKMQNELEKIRVNSIELESLKTEYNEKLAQLQLLQNQALTKQKEIIDEAKEQAAQIILDAKDKTDDLIEKLKSKNNISIKEIAEMKHEITQLCEIEELPENEQSFSVGDFVKIVITNQCGEITDIDKKTVSINCNGVKIKASLSSIEKTSRPKEKVKQTSLRVLGSHSFNIELNVIGCTVEQALVEVDKFLDSALINNAPFVRIVHGVGTGALRKAIWDKLKKLKYVKGYQYAPANQGGAGATIVSL